MKESNTLTKKSNGGKIQPRDFWFNPHVAEKSAAIMVRETVGIRHKDQTSSKRLKKKNNPKG
ncbi:MAG: hypothetical protein JW740_02700 [Candidatus Zambryskibacteria bacterium]|nr:hypothetical protein [Candidatus Zambryskibacteria bacterium]